MFVYLFVCHFFIFVIFVIFVIFEIFVIFVIIVIFVIFVIFVSFGSGKGRGEKGRGAKMLQTYIQTYRPSDEAGPRGAFA